MKPYKPTDAVRIFVVEDDPMYQRMIRYTMELNPDHEVHVFSSGKECLDKLHLKPTIISLDYKLPDISGEKMLENILRFDKYIKVVILSGQEDIATAVDLLKKGAADYITKDDETRNRLLNTVDLLKENTSLVQELTALREEVSSKYEFGANLIGQSEAMQQIFRLMERAVENDITVSISGETGTGKEVVAKTIHYNSPRKKGRFVAVNMSAIPQDLLESELFGHEKGAFTGAVARKRGKFELADKGTLFLDEIGEMEMHLQAKLLRALQEREITRVGAEKNITFDCRVIIATNRSLVEEVSKGNFREDLYYRILGLPIELPPLRDRGGDIILLAKFFLEKFIKKNPQQKGLHFSKESKKKLLNYNYPGNVRELKAIVDLAAVLTTDKKIADSAIQFRPSSRATNFIDEDMTLKDYTRKIVLHYLKKYKNVKEVAKKLDMGKSTLYKMLKEDEELNRKHNN